MTGAARVLNLLHAAHPDDVPRVLALLPDDALRAALRSEHCDPGLRAVATTGAGSGSSSGSGSGTGVDLHAGSDSGPALPDREALCRALLEPRPLLTALVAEPGRAPEAVCLASRTPYQPMLPEGVTPFGRAQADLRRLIRARLAAALGDSPMVWHGVLSRVGAWDQGSLADLVALATTWGPRPPDSRLPIRFRNRTEVFPPGVLFAMAPRRVGAAILAHTGPRSQDLVEGLLKHAPYHPAYLSHVFGPAGTAYHASCLAQNASMPLAAAHDFLSRTDDPRVPDLIGAVHDDLVLRRHANRVTQTIPDARPNRTRSQLLTTGVEQIHAALAAAASAEALVDLLVELRPTLGRPPDGPGLRLLAYRRLAELAGCEAVWAVELRYARSLDRMLPAVRASMTAESAAPIHEAAAAVPPPGPPPPAPHQDPLTEWPLEEAVRAHLDHRVGRWRVLIELADADPAPVLELVRRAGGESAGQTVRPAARGVQDLNRTPPAGRPVREDPALEGEDR